MAVGGTLARPVTAVYRARQHRLPGPLLDLRGCPWLTMCPDAPAVHGAVAARFGLPLASIHRARTLPFPGSRLKRPRPVPPGVMAAAQAERHYIPVASVYFAYSRT